MSVLTRWRNVYYAPDDDIAALLGALPGHATKSIDVEVYGFTLQPLADALLAAAQRGIAVRIMADRSQSAGRDQHALLQRLVDARLGSLTVKIVESEHGAIDHLKQIIVDGMVGALANESSVLNGSYNFSGSAARQDNSVQWSNDPGEVALALAKFEHDWQANEQRPEWQIVPSAQEGVA